MIYGLTCNYFINKHKVIINDFNFKIVCIKDASKRNLLRMKLIV